MTRPKLRYSPTEILGPKAKMSVDGTLDGTHEDGQPSRTTVKDRRQGISHTTRSKLDHIPTDTFQGFSRVMTGPAGRIWKLKKHTGRVGPGQAALEISRLESGRARRFFEHRRSGRVTLTRSDPRGMLGPKENMSVGGTLDGNASRKS